MSATVSATSHAYINLLGDAITDALVTAAFGVCHSAFAVHSSLFRASNLRLYRFSI